MSNYPNQNQNQSSMMQQGGGSNPNQFNLQQQITGQNNFGQMNPSVQPPHSMAMGLGQGGNISQQQFHPNPQQQQQMNYSGGGGTGGNMNFGMQMNPQQQMQQQVRQSPTLQQQHIQQQQHQAQMHQQQMKNQAAGGPVPQSQQQPSTNTSSTALTQQLLSGNPASVGSVSGEPSQANQQQIAQQQPKELNPASLCRYGQETVQEIVSRTQEVFQILKLVAPPEGRNIPIDRKPKFQETLKNIRALFKRLRVIYDKIEESFPSVEDKDFEESIPLKNDDVKTSTTIDILSPSPLDDKRNTESYKQAVEEYKEIVELVAIRNRHLKETIDHLRQIIWDINTMLTMRKE